MAKPVFSAKHFHDEQAAFDHIEALLWPNGPVCPHCGGEGDAMKVIGKASVRKDGTVKPAPIRIGVKKCRACQVQFTVRVGTIFEDSRAPMHVWLQAIALLTASKKGMSSNQLSRTLGVTLKTAWFMSHRIRMAMSAGGSRGPMGGAGKVVEVDETYFGKVENETDVRADGKPIPWPHRQPRFPIGRLPKSIVWRVPASTAPKVTRRANAPSLYAMPAKKPPNPDEKPQKERFIEAAKKAEVDPDAFDRALKKILPAPKKPKR
jgi:transposase-like protein